MIFRQLFDPASSNYSYLIACRQTREAVMPMPARITEAVPANLRGGEA
jgi:hypothetical protein